MSNNNCQKCYLPIDEKVDSFTVCEGRCSKSFHLECVGLQLTVLSVLSRNILWLCDEYLAHFCRYREQNASDSHPCGSVRGEITELKTAVAAIAETLAIVKQNTESNVPHSSTPIEPMEMVPQSSFNYGSKTETTTAPSHTEECGEFSLYLSHIDTCATESDISQLVSRSLAAPLPNCKEVVKLVPRWQNINTLDYVSFKVVLDKQWKSLAMHPSTWPKGVVFREFVNRLNETWKPN